MAGPALLRTVERVERFSNGFDETSPSGDAEPLHNFRAEQELLGALLCNNDLYEHVGSLTPEHFADPLHGRIFDGIAGIIARGLDASPHTLDSMLRADLIKHGKPDYLFGLTDATCSDSPEWVARIANTIRDLAVRRQMVDRGESMAAAARQGVPVADIIAAHEHLLESVRPIADAATLTLVNAVDLADTEPPPRQWLVPDWIPAGTLTLLYGPPSVGKSYILQQLGAAVASGRPWFGQPVTRGGVIALFGEDDASELHRRAVGICRTLGIELAQLDTLLWEGRAGMHNVLATVDDAGIVRPTGLFRRLEETIAKVKPKLVIIDNIAQCFAGNENSRSEVTQFGGLLIGLCVRHGTTVVLAGHPAKLEGSEYSGSTAWDAVCRSRLLLQRPKANGEDIDDLRDARVLKRPAANYSPGGGEIALRWQDGAFVAVAPLQGIDRAAANATLDRRFMELLAALEAQGRHVSDKTGRNYAPALMVAMPDAGASRRGFEEAMARLFHAGRIRVVKDGPPSRQVNIIKAMP